MNTWKKSKSAIILLHEIYGINSHMEFYKERFSELGYDVYCPNLLKTIQPFSYFDEQLAYQNFTAHVGFKAAANQVSTLIKECAKQYEHIFLVGFSIGATIAWLCSREEGLSGVVGYYGSCIRDYLDASPRLPALLIFAEHEKSFISSKVADHFAVQKNTECLILGAKHGFCNPYTDAYNEKLSEKAFALVTNFLEEQRKNTSMDR